MFTMKSINKVIAAARKAYKLLSNQSIDQIKLCISQGNRKIGRVMNVSLMPIMTCANCKQCKRFCYDVKACLQYPETVISARVRNTYIARTAPEEFFRRIDTAISRRRRNKFFRWHVAGDILDMNYFENMVEIARRHPDFIFWTYTKNYVIVNAWIAANGGTRDALPANLRIMFSDWDGLPMINPYGLPGFACKLKAGNKDHAPEYFDSLYKCPGNCDICKAAHRGCIAGENTYADEH